VILDFQAATHPNPKSAANRIHGGWQAYFLFMYVFGFFLGCVNIVVCAWYAQSARPPARTRVGNGATRSSIIYYAWHCARILVFLPVAVILGLGPFFSPFVGVKIGQKVSWFQLVRLASILIYFSKRGFIAVIHTQLKSYSAAYRSTPRRPQYQLLRFPSGRTEFCRTNISTA
jgi:hypothetical protein